MFTSNNEWFVTKKLITGAISDWHAGLKRPCDGGYDSPSKGGGKGKAWVGSSTCQDFINMFLTSF